MLLIGVMAGISIRGLACVDDRHWFWLVLNMLTMIGSIYLVCRDLKESL